MTWRADGTALIKVLDFGVSKVHAVDDLRLTNTQSLPGTPAYMSPEQMRSARLVDPRTDVWSLGVVLYELIEGRRPFEAENFTELCVKVSIDPPAAMEAASAELQRVVFKALEKKPEQRYGSMAELGRDLLPFVTNHNAAVIIVERIGRMFQRRASEIDDDPTTPEPQPMAPVVAPPPAVRSDASSVDSSPEPRDKRWPEVTPTTEPDLDIAHLVEQRMLERAAGPVPDAPPIVPAIAPALVPAPPLLPRPAIADKLEKDPVASDDDTIFEVGSTHVPFSDRRGDDLVPTPLPLHVSRQWTPARLDPPGTRALGARIGVIVVVVLLTVGVGMLAIAWILSSS